jgi:predicted transcriptional regulator
VFALQEAAMNFSDHDAVPLTQTCRLERERIHSLLIADAQRGLADIKAGRTVKADETLAQLQQRRKAAANISLPAAPGSANDC